VAEGIGSLEEAAPRDPEVRCLAEELGHELGIGWLRDQTAVAVHSGSSATEAAGEEWEIQATTVSVSC
jgi:hypothetical protein